MTRWAQARPFLLGVLLAADVAVLIALAVTRPKDWGAPLGAFGVIFFGLLSTLGWAISHRHD